MVKDFYKEFTEQFEYFDMDVYGAILIQKYVKQRRRGLITLKEYVDIRNAIEEQLFHI
jgi:hypothetical protein